MTNPSPSSVRSMTPKPVLRQRVLLPRVLLQPAVAAFLLFAAASRTQADEPQFVPLFDGDNLAAFTMGPEKSWVVEDGAITLRREFDGREHNRDYLWTKEQYGDFELRLEFKVATNTNSGIYIRTADRTDPVYTGIEVQVANSYGQAQTSRTATAGAIYDCLAPSENALQAPGQWNTCVVRCTGPRIQVWLNDKQIIDMNLDSWTTSKENPDGTPNKFGTALRDFARTGYVGFQDHGRPVWYRNVRIRRLD